MSKLSHPSLLSVIRSHNVSAFPFFGVKPTADRLFSLSSEALHPVLVTRETVRGTQAAAATAEAKRGVPNVQAVDFARLPAGTGALLIEGNVLVTNHGTVLETCNEATFAQAHAEFIGAFGAAGGVRLLAERYVMNLLNGSILFRNRIGLNIRCAVQADGIEVELAEHAIQPGVRLSLSDIVDESVRVSAERLVDAYASALRGDRSPLLLKVRAYAEMDVEQEVYPSQEFVQDQDKGQGRCLARAARQDGLAQTAFHGRKVGNALRTIDTWYPNALKALPVEPFGVDQSAQAALRGGKTDFYNLMLRMPELTQTLRDGAVTDEALFVAAVFVRGGVFSKSSKKEA